MENPGDGAGEFFPFGGFERKLFSAFWGKTVEFGAAVVFGNAFFDGDPAAFDKAVQGGIEGALLDLENVLGVALDVLGYGVAVGRTGEEGTQDEQVERALEEVDAIRGGFGRHSR